MAAGCHHPCCRAVEYYWDFYGTRKCKCTDWDYVCLGQAQPPLLEAELLCTAWGSGGWCAGALDLGLTATNPHGGEVMLSGDLNPLLGTGGTPFACPASVGETTCAAHPARRRAQLPLPRRRPVRQPDRTPRADCQHRQPASAHPPARFIEPGARSEYSMTDGGCGLVNVGEVIIDPVERYPKVHWDEAPGGTTFESTIAWDGRWADSSLALPSEYLAWVKASDQAGNESFAVGRIRV